jgi:hypothetical protein
MGNFSLLNLNTGIALETQAKVNGVTAPAVFLEGARSAMQMARLVRQAPDFILPPAGVQVNQGPTEGENYAINSEPYLDLPSVGAEAKQSAMAENGTLFGIATTTAPATESVKVTTATTFKIAQHGDTNSPMIGVSMSLATDDNKNASLLVEYVPLSNIATPVASTEAFENYFETNKKKRSYLLPANTTGMDFQIFFCRNQAAIVEGVEVDGTDIVFSRTAKNDPSSYEFWPHYALVDPDLSGETPDPVEVTGGYLRVTLNGATLTVRPHFLTFEATAKLLG